MSRRARPWERKGRGWFVQLNGKQVPLGREKKLAFKRFHELMAEPESAPITKHSDEPFVVVCDAFLEWTKTNRAPRTFDWYLGRLQSFINYLRTVERRLPACMVKPLHVENWLKRHPSWNATTRRASIIAVQRCFNWAEKMEYIDRSHFGSHAVRGNSSQPWTQKSLASGVISRGQAKSCRSITLVFSLRRS